MPLNVLSQAINRAEAKSGIDITIGDIARPCMGAPMGEAQGFSNLPDSEQELHNLCGCLSPAGIPDVYAQSMGTASYQSKLYGPETHVHSRNS